MRSGFFLETLDKEMSRLRFSAVYKTVAMRAAPNGEEPVPLLILRATYPALFLTVFYAGHFREYMLEHDQHNQNQVVQYARVISDKITEALDCSVKVL